MMHFVFLMLVLTLSACHNSSSEGESGESEGFQVIPKKKLIRCLYSDRKDKKGFMAEVPARDKDHCLELCQQAANRFDTKFLCYTQEDDFEKPIASLSPTIQESKDQGT